MYSFPIFLRLTLAIAHLAASSPVNNVQFTHAVKESHKVPSQWTRINVPLPQHVINLHIGLKQNRYEDLEKHLVEASDPSNSRYGQHLSHEEVIDCVRPSEHTLDQVHNWLSQSGIGLDALSYSPAKDWINVALPVSQIETLLDTTYGVYQYEDGETRLTRAPEWSLPFHLHKHIDTIQPTNSFFRPNARKSTLKPVDASDDVIDRPNHRFTQVATPKPDDKTLAGVCRATSITPRCLRTLYGTIDYKPQAPNKVSMGLNNYLGESSNRSDVRVFLEKLRPDAVLAADEFSVVTINGGKDEQNRLSVAQRRQSVNTEGNLDAQTMLGIAYPIPLTTFNTGGKPPFNPDETTPENTNEPYAEYLQYLISQRNLPSVISSSYGDDEQTLPKAYAIRVCNTFAQLGARGVSFLVSSGDSGVGRNGTCNSNDGKNTAAFLPDFPASCPWVTAVGGTKGFEPEIAALNPRNGFTSGGGFSNYFERPAYQASKGAVKNYIDSLQGKNDRLFNCEGRGYPDLSAQSQSFIIAYDGDPAIVDGTSASCPTVAAIIALVNDALVAAGKPVLGFLNPWLYARGYTAFTDVVSGSAQGCNTDGFPAKEGWDAVTGFGTPFFPALKDLALGKVFRAGARPS